LPNFLNFIKNPKRKEDQIILNGFLRGLAAAERRVSLTKKYSLSRISLSFDPHSDEINLYRKILSNIGVESGGKKGNELFKALIILNCLRILIFSKCIIPEKKNLTKDIKIIDFHKASFFLVCK